MIEINSLGLGRVVEITPKRFGDDRGFFSETYNKNRLNEHGIIEEFVQDNHSLSSKKGTLRGLHFQIAPMGQAKLVRVIKGRIFDVAVDIQKGSETFGQWVSIELSAEKGNQIFVPSGFAHAFLTLEDDTEIAYKVDQYYSPEHDRSVRYDDPAFGIEWPKLDTDFELSDKDKNAPYLKDL
ncbi:MAG: dTDP-4-dehydrorhamnose 3,5-epimerase [Rhizobiaceae bacterium]|nr:dTDP-4-dehydrorhamnose 3,5-epimerase [Rhizobiaceae bacterium]